MGANLASWHKSLLVVENGLVREDFELRASIGHTSLRDVEKVVIG